MGLNIYCACHRCRESVCISRGDEHQGLHSFYSAHSSCARLDTSRPSTVIEVGADNGPWEQDWQWDDALGYTQWWFTATEPDESLPDHKHAERWQMGWRVPS